MSVTAATFHPTCEWTALEEVQTYQGGLCAGCSRRRRLIVDHDHTIGLVRGLLCYACNAQEGRPGDRSFDAYRRNPPARMLGLPIEYGIRLGDAEVDKEWRAEQSRRAVEAARRAGAPRRTRRARALAAVLLAEPDARHTAYDLRNSSGLRAGSIYDLVNRMMAAGWLTDGWEDPAITRQQKRPPRRYYTVTPAGRAALADLIKETP